MFKTYNKFYGMEWKRFLCPNEGQSKCTKGSTWDRLKGGCGGGGGGGNFWSRYADFSPKVVAINHAIWIFDYKKNKSWTMRCERKGFIYYTTFEIQVDQDSKGLLYIVVWFSNHQTTIWPSIEWLRRSLQVTIPLPCLKVKLSKMTDNPSQQ